MANKQIEIGYGKVSRINIGNKRPLAFIGGPCAIESRDHAFMIAAEIQKTCERLKVPWIYKSCYDKDCRSSGGSFQGIGIDDGLEILAEVLLAEADWEEDLDLEELVLEVVVGLETRQVALEGLIGKDSEGWADNRSWSC